MDRIAVFVDSGYLFAQGSSALHGSKVTRSNLSLDAPKVISELKAVATEKASDCKLLRIYWYDGAIGGTRPTTDQASLASLDDVKLRLGFVNSHGQQKGVDSLIVTDLIELARLNSISDALLLSGDEDVRIGVQIAQNYGVRVHLLGIIPSRGSQSAQLLQEADTTEEWSKDTIAKFLTIKQQVSAAIEVAQETEGQVSIERDDPNHRIEAAIIEYVRKLGKADMDGVISYWKTERGVPPDIDKVLLTTCGRLIGRELERNEIRYMRSSFQRAIANK